MPCCSGVLLHGCRKMPLFGCHVLLLLLLHNRPRTFLSAALK
jgi:hypothetical protein